MSGFGAWRRIGAGVAAAALSVSSLGLSYPAARKAVRGDEAYRRGDYGDALQRYSEALAEAPEEPRLFFNIGDVLYRQGGYPEAVKLFQRAAVTGDSRLRAKSWYNIGNAHYRSAAREGAPEAAGQAGDMEALKRSAASYIRALECAPDDLDAKYNLEFVQREIRKLEQQQQKQKDKEEEKEKEKEKDKRQEQQDKDDKDKEDEQDKPPQFTYRPAPDEE